MSTFAHRVNEFLAISVSAVNRIEQSVVRNSFLFKNCGESLLLKGAGIQDLVASAACCGSARISQMEFAPARETMRSAHANR